MIRVTAYPWVPPFAQGLVRDLRVRWALEEAGLRYEEKLLGREEQLSRDYRRVQPFGQVPAYEEDGLEMFESGAIVLHIAERYEILLPSEPKARARAQTWMFAALNSVEPHVLNLAQIDLFCAHEPWAKLRRPGALGMVEKRLDDLTSWLRQRDYLEGRFTAGDLLMTTVLRFLRHTDMVERRPALHAYQTRCEARPAFKKALADQIAPFAKNAPPTS